MCRRQYTGTEMWRTFQRIGGTKCTHTDRRSRGKWTTQRTMLAYVCFNIRRAVKRMARTNWKYTNRRTRGQLATKWTVLAKVYVKNVYNVVNADGHTVMPKTDEMVLPKRKRQNILLWKACFPVRTMLIAAKRHQRKMNASSSATYVEELITEDAMKKRRSQDDSKPQTERETRQKKRKAASGCMIEEGKAPDLCEKREQKGNPARKPSTTRAIMTLQRSVAKFMIRFGRGNATQWARVSEVREKDI